MTSSSRTLFFALAAAVLALALAGQAGARVLQAGGGNNNPGPPPPAPLPPKGGGGSGSVRPAYPSYPYPYPAARAYGPYPYPVTRRYPGGREGPYAEDPYADTYGNSVQPDPADTGVSEADYYGTPAEPAEPSDPADSGYGGDQQRPAPYYNENSGAYADNGGGYAGPVQPPAGGVGHWLPCWLFSDVEAAIAWGLVDPTKCWPHPSPSPSPIPPPPSPSPLPPSPLPSVSPIPPPPSPSPSPPPPDPSPIPPPSPSPSPPPPSPSPQPPSPSPFPPFSPIPPPPQPQPPVGKVECIPGTTCRTAKYACEMDAECNEWGQCPPSAPIPRDLSFVCRVAAGDCDQEEYCDGISYKCPPDAFQPAGTPCTDINGNDSQCFGGKPEKAEDPYMGPRAGPKGVYHEPPNKWPKGLLKLRRSILGADAAPKAPRAAVAAGLAPSTARPLAANSPVAMPPFVVVEYANSAESGARRYKYNPRVCPLAAFGNDDDDDGGARKGDKRGRK